MYERRTAFCIIQKAILTYDQKEKNMIHQLNPSKRLTAIAKYITDDSIFADIGSDHAYLPCFVCLNNPSIQAIAGEVQKGPYENAKKMLTSTHFLIKLMFA